MTLKLVPIPTDESDFEKQIRDVKVRPILRAAIDAKADVLLTGDKDFLESGVITPKIMTPSEFLEYQNTMYLESSKWSVERPTILGGSFSRRSDYVKKRKVSK